MGRCGKAGARACDGQAADTATRNECRVLIVRLYNRAMKIAVLPGDGIGPEIMDATLEVLRAHRAIDAAVDALIGDAARRTADLGGQLGTRAFGAALAREVELRL